MRRNIRDSRGFTMGEMLAAVAVLVILMSVAFVQVQRYQRSMKQLELDKTAQEIFIAAQNHLTLAESSGVLGDHADARLGASYSRDGIGYRYFFVAPDDSRLSQPNALTDMLPQFSIDDTVRVGGSYVIEYNPDTATVLNVFYSDQSQLSARNFSQDDTVEGHEALFVNPGYIDTSGVSKKDERLEGYNGQIIGWYGGEDAKRLAKEQLYAPRLEVINAERLEVKVSFNANYLSRMMSFATGDARLQVWIEGETSKNKRVVNSSRGDPLGESLRLTMGGDWHTGIRGTTPIRYRIIVLDDVTTQGKQFAKQWCEGSDPLIPGENFTVHAEVTALGAWGSKEIHVAQPFNSLFSSIDDTATDSGLPSANIADISNFRHLENLAYKVSRYNPDAVVGVDVAGAEAKAGAYYARQISDLVWSGDGSATSMAFLDRISEKTGVQAERVRIYPLEDNATKAGTYYPITPSYNDKWYLKDYSGLDKYGRTRSVSNVAIDTSGGAGLFGEVQGATIHDVDLVNFDVHTSDGDAGALAGKLVSCNVESVLAYNDVGKQPSLTDDSSLEIRGSSSVGGLVGALEGKNSVAQCAAAVYVRSTGGNAGGLVGYVGRDDSKDETTIESSYAGGHTVKGAFLTTTDDGVAGRMNVIAKEKAGGLVGWSQQAKSLTITNCYTTSSVYGTDPAGGLVGAIGSGTITNCYAANLVVDSRSASNEDIHGGGLIGWNGGSEVNRCQFLSTINQHAYPLGNGDTRALPGVTLADESEDTYTDFSSGIRKAGESDDGEETARPYDSWLKERYANTYPYATIKALVELEGSVPKHVATHYGDWPVPETLVVNNAD